MATKKKKTNKKQLKKTQFLSKKNIVVAIVLVAIVGGLSLLLTSANSNSYNTSVKSCKLTNAGQEAYQRCLDRSAEALVYRYYVGLLARKPEKAGISFWTGQLVKGKQTPTRVAERMLASTEASWGKTTNQMFVYSAYERITGKYVSDNRDFVETVLDNLIEGRTNRANVVKLFAKQAGISYAVANAKAASAEVDFVAGLYINMLKRKPNNLYENNSEELNYWVNQLYTATNKGEINPGKLSRAQVAARFATSEEAIKVNRSGFVNYVNNTQ